MADKLNKFEIGKKYYIRKDWTGNAPQYNMLKVIAKPSNGKKGWQLEVTFVDRIGGGGVSTNDLVFINFDRMCSHMNSLGCHWEFISESEYKIGIL
jgi:hypothetical protein